MRIVNLWSTLSAKHFLQLKYKAFSLPIPNGMFCGCQSNDLKLIIFILWLAHFWSIVHLSGCKVVG